MNEKTYSHVLSLGHACAVASTLERYGFRDHSGPFDWQATRTISSRINCLNDNFKQFLESLHPDNLLQTRVFTCYYTVPCQTFLVHDFNDWEPVEQQIERVKNQYERRIKTFLENIKEPTLFLYYLYEEDDVKYINENMDFILSSIRKHNEQNDIIFIADEKYKINYPCYYVKNDSGIDISYTFVEQNTELKTLLETLNYPEEKRQRNLAFYRKSKRLKPFRKIIKRIKRMYYVKTKGVYHHSKTWFD